ncbi:hypothetical protein RJ640_026201, partial [Escallonia rubra]
EKIRVIQNKPFVTFYGVPNDMPTLVYVSTAAPNDMPTLDSATLIVESDYCNAVNVIIAVLTFHTNIMHILMDRSCLYPNSAPRPDGRKQGAQAVALRVAGDKAALYNCKVTGFPDTVCDDKGRHFYKNCYIEGTVDFIFGNANSIFVGLEAFFAKVVYAYTAMSGVFQPEGWSDNFHPDDDKTVFYGEYDCTRPGSDLSHRVGFAKKLVMEMSNPSSASPFVEGSKWLLPPASL